jgi:hypothetical protein
MPVAATAPARVSAGPNLNGFEALGSASAAANPNSPAVVSILRVTDMLLPFGLGPSFAPYDPSGTTRYNDTTDPDKLLRWTTLGEAICVSMGYDTLPAPPTAAADVASLLAPRAIGAGAYRAIFDRAQLVLDDFVPFIDSNSNGVFNAANDTRLGLELPLALHVLDAFHAGQSTPAIDRAIPGTVNINTASLPVLRCLPLLSPPWTTTSPNNTDPLGQPWWWRGGTPPPGINEDVDAAAAILAYRDKIDTPLRPSAVEAGIGLPRDGYVSFADESAPGTRQPPNDPYETLTGRTLSTQIGATPTSQGTGVSEQPGLRSTGELLAVRMRTVDPSSAKYRFNMDHLGFDTTTPPPFSGGTPVDSDAPGFTSLNPATTTTTAAAYSIANDYKEKLALAGGVMNTITTRSDYFAVWFLIHGYKRGDCEGIDNDAAMVPSVQRRFLMVVDRSNVTKEGQKPRVLLFKEVPL